MARKAPSVNIILAVFCLALVSCEAKGGLIIARPLPRGAVGVAAETIFNVLQFGAKPGNGQSTQAFIRAWNAACNFNGKARLLVPPGVFTLAETVFQGPCKGPITVQVTGTLKAVADVSEYTGKGWISFDSINGLLLTGGGTFDAQGPSVWKYNDCKGNSNCVRLPATLYINDVQNGKLKGIKLLNSMGFHMHVTNCNFFRAQGLHITAPQDSPNTDGIHISKSQGVSIVRSVIGTGDDCISVGQGSTNVNISKITCGPGHGISVGSLGKLPKELDVAGVVVKNCTMLGTTNGVRIKTWAGSDPSRASRILFDNIVVDNVQNPIIIDQGYGSRSSKPSLVKISDVTYQNIRGTTTSPVAVNLMCSRQAPCQNVRLNNINLTHRLINVKVSATCANAQVISSGIQFPPPCR
ncbi:hypothetical protein RJ640_014773 [Escallonia rubra]|uniref:Exopolygalacturonase-like n=1 Tax=Escallonia rubra TaxID=112253 RepID=A0AA88RGN3_9ASTE|nr:hypothetical protein RJ640_014773 [Escallonia rubra]